MSEWKTYNSKGNKLRSKQSIVDGKFVSVLQKADTLTLEFYNNGCVSLLVTLRCAAKVKMPKVVKEAIGFFKLKALASNFSTIGHCRNTYITTSGEVLGCITREKIVESVKRKIVSFRRLAEKNAANYIFKLNTRDTVNNVFTVEAELKTEVLDTRYVGALAKALTSLHNAANATTKPKA